MKLNELINHHQDEVFLYFSSSEHFSVYENYGDFQVFIVRRMKVAVKSLGFQSEGFLFLGNKIYHFHRNSESFVEVQKGFQGFLLLLEHYQEQNQAIMNSYSSEIERLEDYLFSRRIPGYFMDLWFDIKKDLAKIENFYFRNSVVYREFYRKMEEKFGDSKDEFKDIEESLQFQTSYLLTVKGRQESLHNYYESIKNDRLNKTLLTLTVISGVFLPLNLIVGFFGMNTEGMYFQGDLHGTRNVMLILAMVILVVLMGGKVIQLIDAYVLKYILGRYNFYQNILKRVSDLDQRLKGQQSLK